MSVAATLVEALEPLRCAPDRAAVLLDVDGTLAPIVARPEDATVPPATRARLGALAERYGLVACVSGRQAAVARAIVGLDALAYVGNHGAELLAPGAAEPAIAPELADHAEAVQAFAAAALTPALRELGLRAEDKRTIAALHWRGAPDEDAAERAADELERAAHARGLRTHRGRMVLEVRPPAPVDKGRGVRALLRDRDLDAGLYVGDDRTDLDAFAGLRALVAEGSLAAAVCVGVRSDETPAELEGGADLLVEGPAGVVELLAALAA